MKIIVSLSSLAFILTAVFSPLKNAAAYILEPNIQNASQSCQAAQRWVQEQQILESTVRFVIENWVYRPADEGYDIDHSNGHGTVFAGRYLVTHNHFGVPLAFEPGQIDSGYGIISLYNQHGQLVFKGPLNQFQLVREVGETLVFAHPDDGFFEALGFRSAVFADWNSVQLEKGMEVAQVDWDGSTTRVDWVRIQDIILDDGTPRIVLEDGVLKGASGGGIFYQGVHVANNWLFQAKVSQAGETYDEVTTGALNAAAALDF